MALKQIRKNKKKMPELKTYHLYRNDPSRPVIFFVTVFISRRWGCGC